MSDNLYSLGEITRWSSGGTPSKNNERFWNGSIPWISASSMYEERINSSNLCITKDGLDNGSRLAARDSILLLVRGSALHQRIPICINQRPVAFNQDVKCIVSNKEVINPWYLFYWFLGNRRLLSAIVEDTGIGAGKLDTDLLKNLQIIVPSTLYQEKVISNVKPIDDKIHLLRKQSQTLENIAQTLFKRWFIDFEFANEDGKPYKSSGGKMVESKLGEIPEGWKVVELSELVDVFNGCSYKGSELRPSETALITLKNFDRNGGFKIDGYKEYTGKYNNAHKVSEGDLVIAHTDLTQDAEVLGNPVIVQNVKGYNQLIISMDLVKVESKVNKISKAFLYILMRDRRFKYHCVGYSNGTTVLHLSKNAIPEYLITLPVNFQIVETLSSLMETITRKISVNLKEIQTLTKTRDTLLPKLMSGQIRVKGI